jgi:hypothetical protein
MAHCNLCGRWMLFSSKSGLCDNCRNFLIMDLKNRARIINDSVRIVKATKNPKTRISRTKLLKEQLEHLLDYQRKGIDIDHMISFENSLRVNEYYNFIDNQYIKLIKDNKDKISYQARRKGINKINYPQVVKHIPERTKRLIWITDKNPEEFKVWPDMPFYKSGEYIDYGDIKISIKIGQTNEPSLIYTKWPISRPRAGENVEPPGYYPSYSELTPEQRWVYLDWLRDTSKPTDIGYVFLYYYGLERHLVMGNFEEALEKILDLLKYHNHPSFKRYSTTALVISCYNKGKYDLIPRIPYDYININSAILLFKAIKNIKLTPEEVIALSNRVDFKNKRYIKKYPERFQKILNEKMLEDEKRYGEHLLKRIDWKNSPKTTTITYANTSFPEEARSPMIYDITSNLDFRIEVIDLLTSTHEKLKQDLGKERRG